MTSSRIFPKVGHLTCVHWFVLLNQVSVQRHGLHFWICAEHYWSGVAPWRALKGKERTVYARWFIPEVSAARWVWGVTRLQVSQLYPPASFRLLSTCEPAKWEVDLQVPFFFFFCASRLWALRVFNVCSLLITKEHQMFPLGRGVVKELEYLRVLFRCKGRMELCRQMEAASAVMYWALYWTLSVDQRSDLHPGSSALGSDQNNDVVETSNRI